MAGLAPDLGSIISNNKLPLLLRPRAQQAVDLRQKRLAQPLMIEREIARDRGKLLDRRRRRTGTRLGEQGAV